MQNALNVGFLISAIFTCLALGVGLAYSLCGMMFALLRPRAAQPAAAKVAVESVRT